MASHQCAESNSSHLGRRRVVLPKKFGNAQEHTCHGKAHQGEHLNYFSIPNDWLASMPGARSEYAPELNPETKKKDVVWFALNEDRPLFAFARIWTEYRGERGTKSKPWLVHVFTERSRPRIM